VVASNQASPSSLSSESETLVGGPDGYIGGAEGSTAPREGAVQLSRHLAAPVPQPPRGEQADGASASAALLCLEVYAFA
jgi:hypothetical protein